MSIIRFVIWISRDVCGVWNVAKFGKHLGYLLKRSLSVVWSDVNYIWAFGFGKSGWWKSWLGANWEGIACRKKSRWSRRVWRWRWINLLAEVELLAGALVGIGVLDAGAASERRWAWTAAGVAALVPPSLWQRASTQVPANRYISNPPKREIQSSATSLSRSAEMSANCRQTWVWTLRTLCPAGRGPSLHRPNRAKWDHLQLLEVFRPTEQLIKTWSKINIDPPA